MHIETIYSAHCSSLRLNSPPELPLRSGEATLLVTPDGAVTITLVVPEQSLDLTAQRIPEIASASGQTADGFELTVDTLWIDSTSTHGGDDSPAGTTLTFTPKAIRLVKPGASTEAWTHKEYWLKGPRVIGRVKWSWNGYDFELTSLSAKSNSEKTSASAKLAIRRNGAGGDVEVVRQDTLALLSFASRTRCWSFMEWTFQHTELLEICAVPLPFGRKGTHPLISWEELPVFLASCMQIYVDNKQTYGLDTLANYYCRAYEDGFVEMKFIFASVFMEAFKFFWAQNVSGLPQDKKSNGMIRAFVKAGGKAYGFGELMSMASQHLSLNHNYTFIDNRNALFHTGRTASSQTAPGTPTWTMLKPDLVKLHNEVDDIVLTLLGYRGIFHTYWDYSNALQFPGRTPA